MIWKRRSDRPDGGGYQGDENRVLSRCRLKGKRDDLLAALPTPHEVIASTKDMTICLDESWAAEIRVGSRDSTYLTVIAEGAERILVALKAALPAIPERAARDVDFHFWSMSYGPKTRVLHAQ